jgi:tRNA(fMet)-specific endonuclease VapC
MKRYLDRKFYLSIVSFHEQVIGWHGYINRAKGSAEVVHGYVMFQQVLADFAKANVVLFDDAAAQEFESLRAGRVRIGTMDLRIAAIALTRGFTVLSRNLVDFEKVPGLNVEDWTVYYRGWRFADMCRDRFEFRLLDLFTRAPHDR